VAKPQISDVRSEAEKQIRDTVSMFSSKPMPTIPIHWAEKGAKVYQEAIKGV
jgi:hypothetical protein